MNSAILNANSEPFINTQSIIIMNEPTKICFVCTGNTCRSPMAAAVMNAYGEPYHLFGISAGIFPEVNAPISMNAVLALQAAGIKSTDSNNYTEHIACEVTEEMLSSCDKIVGISDRHTLMLIQAFPSMTAKIFTMPEGIPDPYGGDLDTYKRCLDMIIKGIKEMFHLND